MANWKKFKKFVQKVAKPVAAVAAIVYPPLIPLIGTTLGATSAASAAIVGAAALSGGASAIAGDSTQDIVKNTVLGGLVGGTVQTVAPTAFQGGGLFSSAPAGNASALTNAGMSGQSAQVASAAANKVATEAALNTAVAAGGGLVPSTAGFMSPELISAAGGATNLGVSAVGAAAPAVGAAAPVAGATTGTGAAAAAGATGLLDFAKQNPQLTGAAIGAITGAIDAANAPKEQTTTTSIDPDIKREYMANLERAKSAAAGLGVRQFAQPGAMYTLAEQNLYNLGMTPFGAADIQQFYNPYEEQVVQGALGDIERSRLMQDVADRERASRAGAFGGSRQGVQSALTNEAALRQASSTASGLRQTGFTQAANLGLAARPLNIAGLQTSMGLGAQRDALTQARLDAQRNIELERLGITSGALGLQPARTGETSTQPLYTSGVGSALSGGLTGAYIGSLLQPKQQPVPRVG